MLHDTTTTTAARSTGPSTGAPIEEGTEAASARSALAEALEAIEREWAAGGPQERPPVLPIKRIAQCEEVFKLRSGAFDEYHLKELKDAFRSRDELDPVVVLPAGRSFYLVEGRHRLEAYGREGRTTIPVRYHEGSPKDALDRSIRDSCKTVMPLTQAERSSVAWRLHLSGRYSLRGIHRMTGVSRQLMDIMSRARRDLEDAAFSFEEWWRAREAWKNLGEEPRALSDAERETLEEASGREFAERMRRAAGPTFGRNSNVAAHALNDLLGHKLEEAVERLYQLGHLTPEPVEDNPDF